jgi:hypothetical protein
MLSMPSLDSRAAGHVDTGIALQDVCLGVGGVQKGRKGQSRCASQLGRQRCVDRVITMGCQQAYYRNKTAESRGCVPQLERPAGVPHDTHMVACYSHPPPKLKVQVNWTDRHAQQWPRQMVSSMSQGAPHHLVRPLTHSLSLYSYPPLMLKVQGNCYQHKC